MSKTPTPLPVPYLFNILSDPKEETSVTTENGWVAIPISRMIRDFQQSLSQYPPIPPGTPDPYTPPARKDPSLR
jgi:arylsulfatase